MYPNLYYAFKDLFGVSIPAFKLLQTFGFFVAVAFLAGAYVLTIELRRREKLGLSQGVKETIEKKQSAFTTDLAISTVIAFFVGYKLIGQLLFMRTDASGEEMRGYLLSLQGSVAGGLVLAAAVAIYKFVKRPKDAAGREAKVVKSEAIVMPHQRVPDIIVMAAVAGLVGAKIFHNLENWGDFIADPWGSLFSASGLTFYGGLILAAVVIIWYGRSKKISTRHLIDSAAPALMLAYAIGRMGCQFSGDGDWGILNSAYAPDANGVVQKISPEQFQAKLHEHATFYNRQFGSLDAVHHSAFEKPGSLGFLPDWFFAYGYPHNVINEGAPITNCTQAEYCSVLPIAVYPTPLYEIIACLFFFGILWAIRSRVTIPGVIFGIYLIFNGLERFFIEKIRVNTKYDIWLHPTQAEIISTLMVLTGIALIWYCRKLHLKTASR